MQSSRFAFLLLLAACQGDGGTGPDDVARVVVTPGEVTLFAAGATQQFSAQATAEDGATLSGAAVAWRSSNEAVVRVDATGLVTAVAEGEATVTAAAGDATGQADVTVDIPTCAAPQTVQLAVGGVLVVDPPSSAACALTLPGNALAEPSRRYRVAIVRLTSAVDASSTTASLTLTAKGVVVAPPAAARAAALPPLLSARESALLERSIRVADATERAHERLRTAEVELLRRVGPLHPRAPSFHALDGPQAVSPARRTFQARGPSETSCAAKPQVAAVLVAQNADMAIYQDSAHAAASPLPAVHVQRMLDFYRLYGKQTAESHFGPTPDEDDNGQIVVLTTPTVTGDVAAFAWGGDQLEKSVCPASNEMELVYFNPGLVTAMAGGNYQALETLVHEVKHVSSFNQRVVGTTFALHPTWMEEGSAEIAGEVATRRAWAAAGGPAVNATVTRASFGGGALTADNYGVALRLSRTVRYLSAQPNAVVAAPASGAYSVYGSGWHFHRFLGDAFGGAASAPGADAALFRLQNDGGTPAGLAGLSVVTGRKFGALLADYAAAIMLNGTGAPAPTRAITTYDFPSATSLSFSGAPAAPYPYPVTSAGSNPSASYASRTFAGPIGNAGLRIHDFVSSGPTATEVTVQVEAPARVVVVRLR